MNKTLKMCIWIFIWLIILAIGAGVFIGLSMTPEDWDTTTENYSTVLTPTAISTTIAIPTPPSTPPPEIDDEWIREYTNLPLQWLGGVDFTVNGTIEFKDDRYYIKCEGVDDTNYYLLRFNGYADRVDVKITDKYLRNYYGDTDLRDHKILKAMIKNSREIS